MLTAAKRPAAGSAAGSPLGDWEPGHGPNPGCALGYEARETLAHRAVTGCERKGADPGDGVEVVVFAPLLAEAQAKRLRRPKRIGVHPARGLPGQPTSLLEARLELEAPLAPAAQVVLYEAEMEAVGWRTCCKSVPLPGRGGAGAASAPVLRRGGGVLKPKVLRRKVRQAVVRFEESADELERALQKLDLRLVDGTGDKVLLDVEAGPPRRRKIPGLVEGSLGGRLRAET